MDLPDALPLSMLNQLEYCPRRFWLMYVCGEMEINASVLDGTQQHSRAHGGGTSTEGETVTQRRITVGSERLRLIGVADVVEQRDGQLIPIEYKRGQQGKWLNDHVQVCAQAMCLEEQLTPTPDPSPVAEKIATGEGRIPYGEVFYWGSRRRVRVDLTPELRAHTEATIQHAFDLLERGEMPPPLSRDLRAKCHECSLQAICLPDEVILLSNSRKVK
jgi:CRISPR-associated exonuclease Cas4